MRNGNLMFVYVTGVQHVSLWQWVSHTSQYLFRFSPFVADALV